MPEGIQALRGAAALPLVAALAGCGGESAPRLAVERADSAGVEVVRSLGADVPLGWSFEPTLALGGEDEGPESFYQLYAGAVAVDAAGRIHVLDRTGQRVVVFGPDGGHLRTLGGPGGGPGEFQLPVALAVAPDGTVGVYDMAKQAIVRFAADGGVLEAERLDGSSGIAALALTPEGVLVSRRRFELEQQRDVMELLLRRGGEPTVLARLERPLGAPAAYRNCAVRLNSMPPIFAPALSWTTNGASVAVNAGAEYEVSLYDGGRTVRSVRRDVAPAQATPELAVASVPDGEMRLRLASGECRVPAAEVVEVQGFAPVVPTIAGLALAPDGALWLRRRTVGEEPAPVDVFAPDGGYLGTLPAGSPFPVAFLPDGRILAIEKDELDVQRLVAYRVEQG